MVNVMIICGLVLLMCITSTKILYRFGVPILLVFIVFGMLFGPDGLVGIEFNDYQLAHPLKVHNLHMFLILPNLQL